MKNLKAIIADDHPLFRQIVTRLLLENNICKKVYEAKDGAEALHLCESEDVDLLILDVNMPKIDGLSLAKEILKKPRFTHIKIIVLTMYDDPRFVYNVLSMGVVGYLSKSNGFDELQDAIKTVMNQRVYYPKKYDEHLKQLLVERKTLTMISPKEKVLIHYISKGLSSKEISNLMEVPLRTIETQRIRLEKKTFGKEFM